MNCKFNNKKRYRKWYYKRKELKNKIEFEQNLLKHLYCIICHNRNILYIINHIDNKSIKILHLRV